MDNQLMNLGLTEKNGKIVVSSCDIARVFEKEHDKVLRYIVRLNCSSEFSTANFCESEFVNDQDRTYKEYLLTRDGFRIDPVAISLPCGILECFRE